MRRAHAGPDSGGVGPGDVVVDVAALLAELQADGGQLSIAGRDLRTLPAEIAAKFGATTTALDLSFNALTYGPGQTKPPPLRRARLCVGLTGCRVCARMIVHTPRTVQHLEQFPQLTSLVLDNNALDDTLTLPALPALRTLSLNNNSIEDLGRLLDNLRQACPDLHLLSLLKNPACPNALLGGDDEDYNRFRWGLAQGGTGRLGRRALPCSWG
jgi:hypothetical protein